MGSEIQIWCLVVLVFSMTSFGLATNQAMPDAGSLRLILGVCSTLAASACLSTQSVAKEYFAKKDVNAVQATTNFHEQMIFLFAGAATSSFFLASVQLRGAVWMFFSGWELRSTLVPLSVFTFATCSTLFTRQFGAMETVLLNIMSVVLVFFCCTLFFGQAYSPLVIVLVFLVACSVIMTARVDSIRKEESDSRTQLEERLTKGRGALEEVKKKLPPKSLDDNAVKSLGTATRCETAGPHPLQEPLLTTSHRVEK